ncbi:hypothetical protein D9M72_657950 [compost metagenome]
MSQTTTGVSRPARWPKNRPRMPTWNRMLPSLNWPRCSNCELSDFQVYCSRSKRTRLPSRKTVSAM